MKYLIIFLVLVVTVVLGTSKYKACKIEKHQVGFMKEFKKRQDYQTDLIKRDEPLGIYTLPGGSSVPGGHNYFLEH